MGRDEYLVGVYDLMIKRSGVLVQGYVQEEEEYQLEVYLTTEAVVVKEVATILQCKAVVETPNERYRPKILD